MSRIASVLVFLAYSLLVACSSSFERACEPGEMIACEGPSGCAGAQVCAASGEDFHACTCGVDAGAIRNDAGGPVLRDAGPMDAQPSAFDAGTDAGTDGGSIPPDDGGFVSIDGGIAYIFPARDFVCPVGVAPPCDTTVPRPDRDARAVILPRDRTPTPMAFVLATLAVAEPTGLASFGLNLDGRHAGEGDGTSCEDRVADFTSAFDPRQVGVDNAFGPLVPVVEGLLDPDACPGGETEGCLNATLQTNIDDGVTLLLVELEGVDSLLYDDAVEITLYEGTGSGLTHTPDGRLAPGQTFGTAMPITTTVVGDIFEGRLRARFPALTLPADILPVAASLSRVEVRANVSETALTNGVLAGTADIEAFAVLAPPEFAGVVRSFADVEPTASPDICEELSAAFTLRAVTAIRTP